MPEATTILSDAELVSLGQAMERHGFTSMEDYIHWALTNQIRLSLAESPANASEC